MAVYLAKQDLPSVHTCKSTDSVLDLRNSCGGELVCCTRQHIPLRRKVMRKTKDTRSSRGSSRHGFEDARARLMAGDQAAIEQRIKEICETRVR